MKLIDLFETVKINNSSGLGGVPNNNNVDYLGLRVSMRPSVFLGLAATLYREQATSADHIKQHMAQGGAIASPWLVISIPDSWDTDDFEQPAQVVSHEGRNRMWAVLESEGDEPIECHLFFSDGLRRRHIKPQWIEAMNQQLVPERRNTPIPGPFFSIQPTTLMEALTLPKKYTKTDGGWRKTVELDNNRQMHIDFDWITRPKTLIWSFSIEGGNEQIQVGEMIPVFAVAAESIKEFLSKKSPEFVVFATPETSRVVFFTKLIKYLTAAGGVLHNWDDVAPSMREDENLFDDLALALDDFLNVYDEKVWVLWKHALVETHQSLVELFKGPPVSSKWKRWPEGIWETNFDFQGHLITVEMSEIDYDSISLTLDQLGITLPESSRGYEIIFRVDRSTIITGRLGVKSTALLAAVIQVVRGFLNQHKWNFVEFRGEQGSRNRMYRRLADGLAQSEGGLVHTIDNDFVVYKPSTVVQEVGGVGRIVKGVNTTADVRPGETQRQAKKFLNQVSPDGVPPVARTDGKFPQPK